MVSGPLAPLEDLLTVVLVTSPVPSCPSTEMLEATLGSFVAGGGLDRCMKLIVSDSYTVASAGQQPKPKSGRVPQDWGSAYEVFRDRVDAMIAAVSCEEGELPRASRVFARAVHIRMSERSGFGGCAKAALAAVSTPYILMLQHDRPCLRAFDCRSIVAVMQSSDNAAKYIGLPTKSSLSRSSRQNVRERCGIALHSDLADGLVGDVAAAVGISLRFLFFWYDSAHVCQAEHCRTFVFNTGRVPRGGFPEDTLGQSMHAELCAAAAGGDWREAHAAYGTYLFVDGDDEIAGHLKGRKYLDTSELQRRGWEGPISRRCPFGMEVPEQCLRRAPDEQKRGWSGGIVPRRSCDADASAVGAQESSGESTGAPSLDLWADL